MGGGLVKTATPEPNKGPVEDRVVEPSATGCPQGQWHRRALQKIEEALQVPLLPEAARAALEAAVSELRSIHGTQTKDTASSSSYDLPVEGTSWKLMLESYTDNDPEAAEGHHMLEQKSPKRNGSGASATLKVFCRSFESMGTGMPCLSDMLQEAGQLGFDAIAFSESAEVAGQPLRVLGAHLTRSTDMWSSLRDLRFVLEPDEFQGRVSNFLGAIDFLYRADVPYHGPAHAADVMSTMEWFLQTPYVSSITNHMDHFMGLMAAAIHDVGHPGTNNMFQSKTLGPLALRYNDKSILEMMHVALAFETMLQNEATNWLELLPCDFQDSEDPAAKPANLQHYVRRGLIDMVLGTDMAKHAKKLAKLQDIAQEEERGRMENVCNRPLDRTANFGQDQKKQESLERKLFVLGTALHASDISTPCKPRQLMLRWTERVLLEFWAQGDEELRLQLPISPLCDRASGRSSVAKGQLGFINFVVKPFYAPLVALVPEVQLAMELLRQNKVFWEERDSERTPYEEIFAR
ncbi:unnamed protein product [Polarella glacialis]|uniref:Phosphodiesterase n=1 Tax=Polarella glacialis TaxID=89957 RepID=A0A813GTM0_POLGL|nr:unnamed protein product [Polarella glacialis]